MLKSGCELLRDIWPLISWETYAVELGFWLNEPRNDCIWDELYWFDFDDEVEVGNLGDLEVDDDKGMDILESIFSVWTGVLGCSQPILTF